MKKTQNCPKCQSTDILRVPGEGHDHIATGPLGFLTSIPVTRYVCGDCGYAEQWVDSPDDLLRVREKYRPT